MTCVTHAQCSITESLLSFSMPCSAGGNSCSHGYAVIRLDKRKLIWQKQNYNLTYLCFHDLWSCLFLFDGLQLSFNTLDWETYPLDLILELLTRHLKTKLGTQIILCQPFRFLFQIYKIWFQCNFLRFKKKWRWWKSYETKTQKICNFCRYLLNLFSFM